MAELEIKEAHRKQVCQVLGRTYAKWTGTGRAEQLFNRWPACVLVATTGIASRDYRRGGLWPQLWDELGYDGNQFDQTAWGRGFRAALTALGLPTFDESPLQNLGPILMHAGIPDYCLEDYFRLLDHRRRLDPDLDAESFFQWARGRANRLNALDKPASRFLTYGSEYAYDFVERSFDLLDRLRERSGYLDVVGLPPRVVARAQEISARGVFGARLGHVRWGGASRVERPRIGLDPFGRGVQVVLPSVNDAPGGFVSWSVTADGQPHVVESQARWAGVAESAPPTSFALLRPVRTVVVSTLDSTDQTKLPVIDADNPMLVFDEGGRRIPATAPLAPDVVWVVHPETNELVGDGRIDIVVEGQLPLGWNGWRLRQVNLRRVRSLGLDGLSGTCRPIQGYTQARIGTTPPLRGVTTPYGTPVCTEAPDIWLPAERNARTAWAVEIRRNDGNARAFETFALDEPQTVTELWDRLPRPLLGSFDITIRGSLGRSITRTIFIAESLDVLFTPDVRVFGMDGLASAQAELVPAIGAQAHPRVLTFDSTQRTSVVEYRAGSETEPLVVTPPHVQVMHERADEPVAWSASPVRITADTFDEEPGVLLVRVPGMTTVPRLRVLASGEVVQEVPSSGRTREGTARFELVRMTGTVAAHQQVDLVLDAPNRSLLAMVRPRRLATGVEQVGDVLRLRDVVRVDGLTAGLYLLRAPWRAPLTQLVGADGSVAVPPELRDAGPLTVALRVDDPWAPSAWPRWPSDALYTPGIGYLTSRDPDETALSKFAAGEADIPVECADLGKIWQLLTLAPRLYRSTEASRIADRCAEVLRSRPGAALVALADVGLPPGEVVTAVVSSGLAGVGATVSAEIANRLWPVVPLLGALSAHLDDEDVRGAALAQCGETVDALLSTGVDPAATVCRFGREAIAMVAMQPQQLESLWRAAQVVPRALLDPDSRAVAARRLFDHRADRGVWQVGGMASGIARNALALLDGRPRLRAQITARQGARGAGEWLDLPAASAALALVARLAARGDVRCQRMEQLYRAKWRRLAVSAPELVTIDLVLAELLVGLETEEI